MVLERALADLVAGRQACTSVLPVAAAAPDAEGLVVLLPVELRRAVVLPLGSALVRSPVAGPVQRAQSTGSVQGASQGWRRSGSTGGLQCGLFAQEWAAGVAWAACGTLLHLTMGLTSATGGPRVRSKLRRTPGIPPEQALTHYPNEASAGRGRPKKTEEGRANLLEKIT